MNFPVLRMKSCLPWGLLALLVSLYFLSNSIWLKLDTVPPYNDSAHHLANYRVVLHSLDGSLSERQKAFYEKGFLYAPGYYYFSALVAWLLGDTDTVSSSVNLFFFAVLLIAVYAAGKKLFGQGEGVIACLLLSLYPYIYGSTRIFELESGLCSLAALCVCFLLYSDDLRKLRFTVAAAVVCFLGMMTKQSFLIYVAGPLVLTLGKAIARRDAFLKVILLIGVGVVLPGVLLFTPGTINLLEIHFFKDVPFYGPKDPWARAFHYLLILPDQINVASFVVFVISLAGYIFTKSKDKAFVLAWLLTPLFILTLDPLKTNKYSLPVLPVIALISSWGFYAILKRPVVRYALLGVVLGFGVFVHCVLLWNIPLPINPFTGKRMSVNLAPYLECVHKPRNKHLDKVRDEFFNVLRKHTFLDRLCHVGVAGYERSPDGLINPSNSSFTDNFIVVNEWGMKSYVLRRHLPFVVHPLWKVPALKIPKQISGLDLLVSGMPLEVFYPPAVPFFNLITTLEVPSDGSKIYVYVKNRTRGRSAVFESQWTQEASTDGRLEKAKEAFRKGRYDQSIKWLREFLEGKEATGHLQAVAYVGLASNYIGLMVRDTVTSKDCFSKAEQYFHKALKVMGASDPLWPSVCSGLGYLYLSQRSYEQALSYLNQGLAYYPREGSLKEHGDLLTNVGYCYLGKKDPAKAREYFTQAIAVFSEADYETLKGALTGLELCASDDSTRKMDG